MNGEAAAATGGAGGTAVAGGGTSGAASVPAGAGGSGGTVVQGAESWFNGFKNTELKAYVQERKFTGPEQLAERYQSLEKLRGVPEERLLKLPEKMEGPDARAIFERLGAPKEAKDYQIARDEKSPDPTFPDWAETTFHGAGVTKGQADAIVKAYNERAQQLQAAQVENLKNSIAQADTALKKEWGAQFDANLNLVKQGARILGIDPKTLDIIEAVQGREALFKTLHKIGVSVGESNFVAGQPGGQTAMTPEQAQEKMNELMRDSKFQKKFNRGDAEAIKTWTQLNQAAAPGEKSIG